MLLWKEIRWKKEMAVLWSSAKYKQSLRTLWQFTAIKCKCKRERVVGIIITLKQIATNDSQSNQTLMHPSLIKGHCLSVMLEIMIMCVWKQNAFCVKTLSFLTLTPQRIVIHWRVVNKKVENRLSELKTHLSLNHLHPVWQQLFPFSFALQKLNNDYHSRNWHAKANFSNYNSVIRQSIAGQKYFSLFEKSSTQHSFLPGNSNTAANFGLIF